MQPVGDIATLLWPHVHFFSSLYLLLAELICRRLAYSVLSLLATVLNTQHLGERIFSTLLL